MNSIMMKLLNVCPITLVTISAYNFLSFPILGRALNLSTGNGVKTSS